MKDNYIPKESRKKILFISDDIRQTSGVATVAREIIIHTAHHFNWVNIGGSIQHPDFGKRFDISQDTNKFAGIEDSQVVIYPVSGYGDSRLLREIINIEKPDVLMMITDPRYFIWLFHMECEIRKKMPIVYLNIWDSAPVPLYNTPYYEACDGLLAISKQTKLFNKLCLQHGSKSYYDLDTGEEFIGNNKQKSIISYIPHGLNTNHFKPVEKTDPEFNIFKQNLLGKKSYKFIVFFNSRNIRRKQIPDLILAYKLFCDKLSPEEKSQVLLLLHTQEVDENGTDLGSIVQYLTPPEEGYNVKITNRLLGVVEMNYLYNLASVTVLNSSNEGWGLSLTESLLTGTPIIANVTGGMQDQMGFKDSSDNWFTPTVELPSNHKGTLRKHGNWAYPVYPTNNSLQGSVPTPYIFDDRCQPEDITKRLFEAYTDSTTGILNLKGEHGREWAISEEVGFTAQIMGERVIKSVDTVLDTFTPKKSFELINCSETKKNIIPHSIKY